MRSVSAIAVAVTPRSAARAESGRTISSGRIRLDGRGDVADAGQRAQLVLDAARVLGQHGAVLAGQHQHVLLVRAAEADVDARTRAAAVQRVAQLLLDDLLA